MFEVVQTLNRLESSPLQLTLRAYKRNRRPLIDWVCEIGEIIKMNQVTLHKTVAMLDRYFSLPSNAVENDNDGKQRLQLITLTCLYIAAKFNEKDSRGPTAKDINLLTRGKYSEEAIKEAEIDVLKALDWNLMFMTTADVIEIYLNQGVLFSNDRMNSHLSKLRGASKPNSVAANYI